MRPGSAANDAAELAGRDQVVATPSAGEVGHAGYAVVVLAARQTLLGEVGHGAAIIENGIGRPRVAAVDDQPFAG